MLRIRDDSKVKVDHCILIKERCINVLKLLKNCYLYGFPMNCVR